MGRPRRQKRKMMKKKRLNKMALMQMVKTLGRAGNVLFKAFL